MQGLNTHFLHRQPCNEAYQALLDAQHICMYDPGDPDDHPHDNEPPMDWDVADGLGNLEDSGSLDIPETMEAHHDVNPARSQSEQSVQPGLMEADTTTTIQYPGSEVETYGLALTRFEILSQDLEAKGFSQYYPFVDAEEWQLAETLMTSGMSLKQIDKLLKLPIVSCYILPDKQHHSHPIVDRCNPRLTPLLQTNGPC